MGSARIALPSGAGVTYSDAHYFLEEFDTDLGELIRRIASTQIRNSGTIGGNIANGSPIGDMPPALIALGATVVLGSLKEERALPLEDFFIEYGKQDLKPGEYVKQIIIPTKAAGQEFRTYKISKRFDQDISAVCGAFNVVIEDGEVCKCPYLFRRVWQGPPCEPKPQKIHCAGQPWIAEVVQDAMGEMLNDYAPMSDMRASEDYRMQVAQKSADEVLY